MTSLRFIDLFAGIGGIRMAFEQTGMECVFSSEKDPFARKTYAAFFGAPPENADINELTGIEEEIPSHDVLTAGFPCQPFSNAGVSKKLSLGRPHGFDDPTQGTLFFNIRRIIAAKEPRAVFLENVKNLKSHDQGNTFRTIMEALREPRPGLRYVVESRIIDAAGWVPQHRERIYIIAFREDLGITQEQIGALFPKAPESRPCTLADVLIESNTDDRYTVTPGTWATLERHKEHHRRIGQGFGYGLIDPLKDQVTRTLSARYHKDGAEILITQGKDRRPRRLSPRECFRLQGFYSCFEHHYDGSVPQPVSNTQAYRQLGNSVAVPVIHEMARNINNVMLNEVVAEPVLEDGAAEFFGEERAVTAL